MHGDDGLNSRDRLNLPDKGTGDISNGNQLSARQTIYLAGCRISASIS